MHMIKKTSISDLPFNEVQNDFGTDRYVDGLIKFIENSSTPITIALQGEWGSGKTSLMTRLKRVLCDSKDSKFVGIEINTWEHSMLASPEMAVMNILECLIKSISGGNPEPENKFKKYINVAFKAGREAIKVATGPIGAVLTEAFIRSDFNKQTQNEKEDEKVSLHELRESLNKSIKESLTGNKRGVIVFVDDLDRLNPPVAVEILELLKNIFTLDNCIFVLAIDYDVVVKGLKPKYGELTEKNEREFRSFFDKIIQVPFSLPVNNYRPMDFVLKSLVDIGYIKGYVADNPEIRSVFTTIVEASVGKNPRSIKRLINTLSLLDCISQCGGASDQKSVEDTLDDKLLNFIAVSIQVCYPKIYRMLSLYPGFTGWNKESAQKMGITSFETENSESAMYWEDIIEAACKPDAFLSQHLNDIVRLLNLIIDILGKTNQAGSEQLSKKMKKILDKSSVTSISSETKDENFDKKDLIYKLHKNVTDRIREKRPDITKLQLKRNTGNGGVYVWTDDDTYFDVTFTPEINKDNQISLRIWLDLHISRPERLNDKSFDELMQDQLISDSLHGFDSVLSPMLKDKYFFKGRVYDGNESYFQSLTDELRFIHDNGWMSGDITNNPQFWIELGKPSYFEEAEVVDTIADIIAANYDFRRAMSEWK